jgi:hypothetical protein
MISLGIIGYGYWGPNVARNFNNCLGTNLVSVSELNESAPKLDVGDRASFHLDSQVCVHAYLGVQLAQVGGTSAH